MNKLFLIPFLFLLSCTNTPNGESSVQKDNYVIKTIDNCEYIEYNEGSFDQRVYSLTHKGNCKNEFHNLNK